MIYIFDFDGTIARLFANTDLHKTSEKISEAMKKYGVNFDKERDAFDVFALIGNSDDADIDKEEALLEADHIISEMENEAVESCEIIQGAVEFIESLVISGEKVAIATNNSSYCIEKFAAKYFKGMDITIVGRYALAPDKMKPNPYCLERVAELTGCDKQEMVFIGDNPRDYECARGFGCEFIGMAPNDYKYSRFKHYIEEKDIVRSYLELTNIINIGRRNLRF